MGDIVMALAAKIERRDKLSSRRSGFLARRCRLLATNFRLRALIRGASDAILSPRKKHCYTRTRLPGKP
jgi:hypothetical protein